jgi:2-furoate---CoA ligase
VFDVGQSFLLAVAREPGALAVVDGARRQTYAEWRDDILRCVAGLDRLGLTKGDHVVSVLQNNWQMATLYWACQLAGIIITPINWRAKGDELDYVLQDSDARALFFQDVSQPAVAEAPSATTLPRIAIGGVEGETLDFETLLEGDAAEPVSRATPNDTSVMLYTSGTTGRGKGVPRSHYVERAAVIAHCAQNLYRFGERNLGVMPLYHTMGVRCLLSMAAVGGRYVCLPRFDVETALGLITAECISNLCLVPTLFHDILAHPTFKGADISSVRNLGFAGAPMTDGLLKRLDATFKPDLFINHYGSSEIYTFTIDQNATAKPGSAGKAGLNQEIRVVKIGSTDPTEICDVDEEGQIIARLDGDESFAGYWRRPDADEKSLHAGWYFTGDTGNFDADGDLFVTGRVDDMIITGGENVFPVEVESVLSLHPAVGEVAVAGIKDERWGQQVTAFISRSGEVSAEDLDTHCRASDLADFKRPRAYVFVKQVPRSPVGKILRRMLISEEYEVA